MVGLRGLDAWLTREPDWDDSIPVPPKCDVCGRFLKDKALYTIGCDEVEACTGEDHSEYGPMCASWGNRCPGEPHFFEVNYFTVIYRQCSGGHTAKEFVI